MMNFAYIALGSNLNQPQLQLNQAINELNQYQGLNILKKSSFYITEPIDCPENTPDFVNAVIFVETQFSVTELLTILLSIEKNYGRVRDSSLRNSARTLDLDILLFNDSVINCSPDLIVPHPRMHQRAFVLYPLVEINPNCEIPNLGKAVDYLSQCEEQSIEILSDSLRKIA